MDTSIAESAVKQERLLAREATANKNLYRSEAAQELAEAHGKQAQFTRAVGRSGNLSLMVSTERNFVQNELDHYANSPGMVKSLQTSLKQLSQVEYHIGLLDDPKKYEIIDRANDRPEHRKNGLPNDEGRKGLASEIGRLENLAKARLTDGEKEVINARKDMLGAALGLYIERQAQVLGVDLSLGRTPQAGRNLSNTETPGRQNQGESRQNEAGLKGQIGSAATPAAVSTSQESLLSIRKEAESRGLTIRDLGSNTTKISGVVVAQTDHHMLFQTKEKSAVVLDRDSLDKNLNNLKVGDRLTLEAQKTREQSITTEPSRPQDRGIERDGHQQNNIEHGGREAGNTPPRNNTPDRGIGR